MRAPSNERLKTRRRAVVVCGRRPNEHVAVEPQILLDVLSVMRMIPVDPRVLEADAVDETAARLDRILGHPRNAIVPVLDTDTVPVDGGRQVDPIGEIDDDLRAL
jgi:hypothetical protein